MLDATRGAMRGLWLPHYRKSGCTMVSPPASWWSYVGIAYITWRVYWANRMPIMDCDEVYNYFEPLHFLHHGSGMQTWEYASQYALRTYAYLLPMQGLSRFYEEVYGLIPNDTIELLAGLLVDHPVLSPKVWAFCCLRSTLAGCMALAEVSFCRALEKRFPETCWITCLLLLTSAGMSHAAGAYLPSSSVLLLFLASLASWWNQNHVGAMACAVVATLAIGWPFCAVLFVPMGLHVLYQAIMKGSFSRLLLITIFWTLLVQGIVMVIDHQYYGRWVSPVYNIFAYNAQGGGDELYGVEPASYYIKNLLLNFNYVALLALPSPLLVVVRWRCTKVVDNASTVMLLVTLAPLFLWLAIVVPRPHKEERFLFPIYPLLCIGAAITLDCMWDLAVGKTKKRLVGVPKLAWCMLVCAPACIVSACRTGALSTYYTAPLSVYAELQQLSTSNKSPDASKILVCTCGEWYRFPSGYYLPPNHELGFLPSSFRGQLPLPFTDSGSKPPEDDSLGGNFNDQNLEEADRYVSSVDACSFVVELVSPTSNEVEQECLQFMAESSGTWSKVAERPYLDASRTSALHRVLYVPYIHQSAIDTGSVQYNSYILYKNDK